MPPKGQRQTLMFSATFPAEIQCLAASFLERQIFVAIGIVGGANPDVEQQFIQVEKLRMRLKLV